MYLFVFLLHLGMLGDYSWLCLGVSPAHAQGTIYRVESNQGRLYARQASPVLSLWHLESFTFYRIYEYVYCLEFMIKDIVITLEGYKGNNLHIIIKAFILKHFKSINNHSYGIMKLN